LRCDSGAAAGRGRAGVRLILRAYGSQTAPSGPALETVTEPPPTRPDEERRTRYVGRSVLRPGDDALLRGEARYVGDLHPEGLLHVALVRSPHPHALIESIDCSAAEAMPGVSLVATGREIHSQCP